MIEESRPQNPDMDVKLLINRKIPGTRLGREARASLDIFDMDVMDSELCQRVAFIEAMTSGVSVMQYAPGSKAADEVEQLCDEITLQETVEETQTQAQNPYFGYPEIQENKPAW
jgi:chromosome partitioning protein